MRWNPDSKTNERLSRFASEVQQLRTEKDKLTEKLKDIANYQVREKKLEEEKQKLIADNKAIRKELEEGKKEILADSEARVKKPEMDLSVKGEGKS